MEEIGARARGVGKELLHENISNEEEGEQEFTKLQSFNIESEKTVRRY